MTPANMLATEQQMNEQLIEKVNNLAGDTPVHYIDYKDDAEVGRGIWVL